MNAYKDWYDNFMKSVEMLETDEQFNAVYSLLLSGKNTFAFNRKIMEKAIDVSWVEAIENGLPHLDNVLRNPRKTIEDVEEIVPIALSRKITVESVKHLAQHTDLIQDIDKKTGKITPSKILNIHKEESLMTYENKFVNTLVDRLFVFINIRYQKLLQVARDEEVYTFDYEASVDNEAGRKMNISLKVETADSLETANDMGFTVWDRVEKIKKAIEGYKGSILCTTLGNTYIRPPVMRTNAIMKNVDLKACLVLWQYIEGYDKVGYEINISNTAKKPDKSYVDDIYKLAAMNLLLLRTYTNKGAEGAAELKTQKSKTIAPKFLRKFEKEDSDRYDVSYYGNGLESLSRDADNMPDNVREIAGELNRIIEIETQFFKDEENRRIAEEKARAEAERKRIEAENARLERERIEREMQEERERIQREKEEEKRRVQEMLAKKRAEQEAREKAEREERERLEREEQERIAEQLRLEEEERQRRLEEERQLAEQQRIREDKVTIRNELAAAQEEFVADEVQKNDEQEESVQTDELAKEDETPAFEEIESPEVAAQKAKEKQQQLEIERRERERADKLREDRARIESKDFSEIYREYSKNPFHMLRRGTKALLANVFGIIPEDTDNPDLIKKLAEIKAEKLKKEQEKQHEREMERLYAKYSPMLKYKIKRQIDFMKFKRKKRKNNKKNPKPYIPVQRTPQEQAAIDNEMKQLYKKYHVSTVQRIARYFKERAKARSLK